MLDSFASLFSVNIPLTIKIALSISSFKERRKWKGNRKNRFRFLQNTPKRSSLFPL